MAGERLGTSAGKSTTFFLFRVNSPFLTSASLLASAPPALMQEAASVRPMDAMPPPSFLASLCCYICQSSAEFLISPRGHANRTRLVGVVGGAGGAQSETRIAFDIFCSLNSGPELDFFALVLCSVAKSLNYLLVYQYHTIRNCNNIKQQIRLILCRFFHRYQHKTWLLFRALSVISACGI